MAKQKLTADDCYILIMRPIQKGISVLMCDTGINFTIVLSCININICVILMNFVT